VSKCEFRYSLMFIYIYILRGEVWTHKTSLIQPFFFFEESGPTQENLRSCICELRVSNMPLFTSLIRFWNCSDSVVFLELLRQCGIFFFFFVLFLLKARIVLYKNHNNKLLYKDTHQDLYLKQTHIYKTK